MVSVRYTVTKHKRENSAHKEFMKTTASVTRQNKIRVLLVFVSVFSLVFLPLFSAVNAQAASLTHTLVRFDRMQISTPTTGTVCTQPSTAGTETTVQVTFPTGYSLGLAATFTVDGTTNLAWPTGGTAWPGIGTASSVVGQIATFPSGDLTVGVIYCFNWINTAAVTTSGSATSSNAGSVATFITGPTLLDSEPYMTATVTSDQILVTASVPEVFSFALSANTDPLGILSSGSVVTSGTARTATVSTNAANGWSVWAKDLNTGLRSATLALTAIPSTTPGTNSVLSAGTTGYNTGVTTAAPLAGATPTITVPFVGGASRGGGLDVTLRTLATATGPSDTAVLTLRNNVAISSVVPAAADYADTITVVGAGLF